MSIPGLPAICQALAAWSIIVQLVLVLNVGVYFFTTLTVMEDPPCKEFRYC